MLVKEFLDRVRENSDQPLLFEFAPGKQVQGGYHVTEIKNVVHETIDCGNSLHQWKEVVLQVWVPEEAKATDPYMPTTKFLKIWNIVDSRLSLYQDAEIKVEYGDGDHLTSNYHVDAVHATEDGVVVQMAPPRTMCKPREILIEPNEMRAGTVASTCCAPAGRQETVLPLEASGGIQLAVTPTKVKTGCC